MPIDTRAQGLLGIVQVDCKQILTPYDIVNDYEGSFAALDNIIGREYLLAIHLNDTKKPLGSRVDRHESIGLGLLGLDFFKRFMKDSRFDNIAIILETPDESRWADEINLLRSFE